MLNRTRFPHPKRNRPEDTKRTITCRDCLIPYTYFPDQVAGTPEKCRDCKRRAFLEVLQSAKT